MAREHRKEKRLRKGKASEADADAVGDGDVVDESNQDKGHLISYCSLDYQRILDMARFRLFKMRQTLKSELEDRSVCPGNSDCETNPLPSHMYMHLLAHTKPKGH